MKTIVYDVRGLTEETLRQAQVFREPGAIEAVEAAYENIRKAAAVLKRGGLVAFPTETVYGIGADAFNEAAVGLVYEAKGRPQDNPMIVHISRASDVGLLAAGLSPEAVKLADAFWPGPLTMVLKKREEVPACVTGGLDTVGVRLPDSPSASALISFSGSPVAAPSANLSGRPSPTKAEHVIEDLEGKVDVILMGPECRVGIESTVVDMTSAPPTILRPGVVTRDDLEAVLEAPVSAPENRAAPAGDMPRHGEAAGLPRPGGNEHAGDLPHPAAADQKPQPAGDPPRSPGMKYRHYAPNAQMLVIEGEREKVKTEMIRLKALNEGLGLRVGVLLFEERDYIRAAHDFYASLRALDEEGADLILAGALPETDGLGFAVMNRMLKAAGYNIARV